MDVEKLFPITFKIMRFTLCHPDVIKNRNWLRRAIIKQTLITIVFILFAYSFFCHDIHSKDLSRVCRTGTMLSMYLSFLQFITFVINKNNLDALLQTMKEDYETAKNLGSEQKKIVHECIRKAARIERLWTSLAIIFTIAFPFENLHAYIKNYFNGRFEYVAFQEMTLPSFLECYKNELWFYVLLYVASFHYLYYATMVYAAFVPLGPILMLHASGQLELLADRMDTLFFEYNNEEVYKELKDISRKLETIYRFVAGINSIFMITSNINMKGTIFVAPIIIKALGLAESLDFVGFVVGSFLYNAIVCYCGEIVLEKGERFRTSLYTCGWERNYDRRTRKFIVLLQTRATRPVAVKIIFQNLCLDTLAGTWQQTYSIFNLLNALWD